jgi:hypothetical protein
MATPGLSRHSFPCPLYESPEDFIRHNWKEIVMHPIKQLKEAPAQAIKIATLALFTAIIALLVSLGKRHG